MLRRSILAAAVSLLMAAGLMSVTPTATAAPRFDNSIGIVSAPNQVRSGRCAKYLFRWNFNPPTSEWTVLIRVRSPKGFSVTSKFWDAGYQNKLGQTKGSLRLPLCGSSVKTGRFKIEMQMIYTDGSDNVTVNRAPTYFRLLPRR